MLRYRWADRAAGEEYIDTSHHLNINWKAKVASWGKKPIENNSSSLQTVPLTWFQNRLFPLHKDETTPASDSQGAKPGRVRAVWRRIGPSLFVNPDFGFLPDFFLPSHSRLYRPSQNRAHLFILPGSGQ